MRNMGEDLWMEMQYLSANGTDIRELEDMIAEAYNRGDINRHWFHRLGLRLLLLEFGLDDDEAAELEDEGDLQAFVNDPQSVHRAPVSEQTNRGLAVLLAVPMPATPDTLDEIADEWGLSRDNKRILHDMKRWYDQPACRSPGDWLYRRALDGLWVTIKASEFRAELAKRLREEAEDAEKKCCDGHITRLVNVMVGFDDRFNPPVPLGELIQQRMSAIAAQDNPAEEKALDAWMALEALGVPEDDRLVWIDAL